eukprot:jgi/Mesen1/6956/ME000360S06231
MHADPALSYLVLYDPRRRLTSSAICLEPPTTTLGAPEGVAGSGAKERNFEATFGDGRLVVQLRAVRNEEGVLEVTLYPKYSLCNNTREPLLLAPGREPQQQPRDRRSRGKSKTYEWPSDPSQVVSAPPGASVPWLDRSSVVLIRAAEEGAPHVPLDLDLLSRATDMQLQKPRPAGGSSSRQGGGDGGSGGLFNMQIGVRISLQSGPGGSPSRLVDLAPRYLVENDSSEPLYVCQEGFQMPVHAQPLPSPREGGGEGAGGGAGDRNGGGNAALKDSPPASQTSFRFRPDLEGRHWDWSGPVCAASLGQFSVKIRAWERKAQWGGSEVVAPGGGRHACMHADPALSYLVLYDPRRRLTSSAICLEPPTTTLGAPEGVAGSGAKERNFEATFGDGRLVVQLRAVRNEEGVLEVTLYPKYSLCNNTREPLLLAPGREPQQQPRDRRSRGKSKTYEWPSDPSQVVSAPPGASVPWLDRSSVVLIRAAEEGAPHVPLDLDLLSRATDMQLQKPRPAGGSSSRQGGGDGGSGGLFNMQIGVRISLQSGPGGSPSRLVDLAPRYLVENDSSEPLYVCQEGFQMPVHAQPLPSPREGGGEGAGGGAGDRNGGGNAALKDSPPASQTSFRFRPDLEGRHWDWSGPVCAASLGQFSVKIRGIGADAAAPRGGGSQGDHAQKGAAAPLPPAARADGKAELTAGDGGGGGSGGGGEGRAGAGGGQPAGGQGQGQGQQRAVGAGVAGGKDESSPGNPVVVSVSIGLTGVRPVRFAVAEVVEQAPSLVMKLRPQHPRQVPYRVENALPSAAISFCQKGVHDWELLEAGGAVGYVWDDLSLPRKMAVAVQGTQLKQEVNPDKVKAWRLFRATRRSLLPGLHFGRRRAAADDDEDDDEDDDDDAGRGRRRGGGNDAALIGYEVFADGPTRIVRICMAGDDRGGSTGVVGARDPRVELDVRMSLLGFTLLETPRPVSPAPPSLPLSPPLSLFPLFPLLSSPSSVLCFLLLLAPCTARFAPLFFPLPSQKCTGCCHVGLPPVSPQRSVLRTRSLILLLAPPHLTPPSAPRLFLLSSLFRSLLCAQLMIDAFIPVCISIGSPALALASCFVSFLLRGFCSH